MERKEKLQFLWEVWRRIGTTARKGRAIVMAILQIWRSTIALWISVPLVLQLINYHFHASQVVCSYNTETAVFASIYKHSRN